MRRASRAPTLYRLALSLVLFLSRSSYLIEVNRARSLPFYPRPYLFSTGFYFDSLALSLLSGLNTFVYDIPCSFFLLALAPYPRVSQFLHFLTISLFLFHSPSFSLIPPTPSDSRYLRRKEDVSFPFFACHYYLRFTIYT